MKQMDPFATSSKKKTTPQYKNFIEAFKDIGKNTVKTFTKDVIGGTAKNTVDILTKGQVSTETPKEDFDFEQYLKTQEKQIKQQERTRYESIRREERVIYNRQQEQTKVEIEAIQTQVQQMAKEHAGLMGEIDKAASQAVVNPGVYHSNFFARLGQLIKLARKKIADSRSWLSLHNHRAKKQSHFWNQVSKSGTSFMLSGERTAATAGN